MVKCGACGRFLKPTEGVKCLGAKCEASYHRACAGLAAKAIPPPEWRCPECKRNVPRDNKAETPVRGAYTNINSESPLSDSNTPSSPLLQPTGELLQDRAEGPALTSSYQQHIIGPECQAILAEVRALRAELTCFRKHMEDELAAIKGTVDTYDSRMASLEDKVGQLEERTTDMDTVRVESIIENLRQQLNDRDQELLGNDVEIANIPESNSENPVHIIMAIGQKLGVKVSERDIVHAERAGRRQLNASSADGPAELRPRHIVVRLARRHVRDELLRTARVKRGATTADLGVSGPAKRFYINERLTKLNRQLFRQARDAANQAGWKFVWSKRGRILACNKPGGKTYRIQSEKDIQTIFTS